MKEVIVFSDLLDPYDVYEKNFLGEDTKALFD